ncbi:MAG: GNAT family N-acetyltransferase [Burkholderiaceae bacterium]
MTDLMPANVERGFFNRADGRALVQFLIEKGQVLVAVRDEQPIGFCQFAYERAPVYQSADQAVVLKAVYVVPAERGAGYGRGLIAHFLAEAQRRGVQRVLATVCASDVLDRSLIRSGFVERRREYQLLQPARASSD